MTVNIHVQKRNTTFRIIASAKSSTSWYLSPINHFVCGCYDAMAYMHALYRSSKTNLLKEKLLNSTSHI